MLAVNQPGGAFREVADVEPGPEGSAWVLYRDPVQPEQYECEAQSSLARYLPDGSLDTAFGSGGFMPLYSPVGCTYASLAVDAQLRPLVSLGGRGSLRSPSTAAIARYTTAGTLDPAFGSGGVVLLTIPVPAATPPHPTPTPRATSSSASAAGRTNPPEGLPRFRFQSFYARLLADGALDTSFGEGGFAVLPLEDGWAPSVAVVEADGSAILSQWTRYVPGIPNRSRLMRLRADGTFAGRYEPGRKLAAPADESRGAVHPPKNDRKPSSFVAAAT